MRFYRTKNQWLIICLVSGFLIGIIFENMVAKREVLVSDIFLKSNLNLYANTMIARTEYALFLMKKRVLLFLVIGLLGCTKWKKIFVMIFLGFLGFCMGKMIVLAVLQLGIGGIVLSMGGFLVHGIFYGIAGAILFTYWYHYPNGRWNYAKTIFLILMIGCGFIMEVYVSPSVAKWLIRLIS